MESKVAHLWKGVLAWLAVTSADLTDDERVYVRNWHRARVCSGTNRVATAGVLLALLTMIPIGLLAPPTIRPILLTMHGGVAVLLATWRLALSRLSTDPRMFLFVSEMLAATGYAAAVAFAFRQDPSRDNIVFLTTMFMAVSVFNVLLCPFANQMILVSAGIQFALGLMAWHTQEHLPTWIIAHGGYLGFAVVLQYARLHGLRHTALQEHESRRLASQNEKLRLETMLKERAIARDIQDNLALPPARMATGSLTASFYQVRHETLGGDWLAARPVEGDGLAILAMDAAGHGVPAALVVHAAQTLWAAALEEPRFDPAAWIQKLNGTLIALGRQRAHAMSVGIAVVGTRKLTYWSAGHVPLLILEGDGDAAALSPVVARGNLLGVTPELGLAPTEFELGAKPFSILLGTDGIFARGVRVDRHLVLSLLASLESEGTPALNAGTMRDDKSLVWVKSAG
jgi:hypothetical protein